MAKSPEDRVVPGIGEPSHYHYMIGSKVVCDPEGMPILGSDGQEFYIDPQDFESLGLPESDIFRYEPGTFDKSLRQGEE